MEGVLALYFSVKGVYMVELIKAGLNSAHKVIIMNMPGILTGVAITGVGATGVFAFKAGMECKEVMLENGITKDNWKEEAKTLAPIIIKPVVVGGITMACMIGSTTLTQRRQAALASMYALSENSLKEFEDKVRAEYGDKKTEKLYEEIAKDKSRKNPPQEGQVIITGHGDYLCYDPISGRYFRSEIEKVKSVINEVNADINSGAFVSVNDYCDKLDGQSMPDSQLGWEIGWSLQNTGLIEPRYVYDGDTHGEPVLIIEHKVNPEVKPYSDM